MRISSLRSSLVRRLAGIGAVAAALALFLAPTSVFADTANTPVGTLTATQAAGACNDLGAVVDVSVSGGFANTSYTANAVYVVNGPSSFATNNAGVGSTQLVNVNPDTGDFPGTATVTVTAAGHTGQVTVQLNCGVGKG